MRSSLMIRLAVAAFLIGLTGLQAAASTTALRELSDYRGADRTDKLTALARLEGKLTIYSSMPVADLAALTDAFTAKYGIAVDSWRSSSSDVLQRAIAESNAGRADADLFELNSPALEALARAKLLARIDSPVLSDILPAASSTDRTWIGTRVNLLVCAYNTDLVKQADLPTAWQGFLDPKWKGMLAVEAEDYDWFGALIDTLGEGAGLTFFRELAAGNGLSVRKGHSLLANQVASGEVPLALSVYQYRVAQMKADGAPVAWFSPDPVLARVDGIAVANTAPHAAAALLFFDFALTDGQTVLKDRNYVPTNVSRYPLPSNLHLRLIDPAKMLDDGAKWRSLFDEIVLHRPQ